jgi:8-oxo-dGTP diphosphatase
MKRKIEKRGPLVVTAAVIKRGKNILIAQRKNDSSVEGLKWEFPGGKLEHGETPEACLKREIKEELGLKIEVGSLIGISSHVYHGQVHIVLLCYLCNLKSGRVQFLEVAQAKWVQAKDFRRYDFALADVPLLPVVKKYLARRK